MAEIEITLPTVQYGNVKVRATPEELGLESIDDATSLGIATAVYLNLFTQGFKSGAQMDVSAALSASQGFAEAQAQRYLDEGLGGLTEVEEYDSAAEAREATQARTAGIAPWNNPQVDSKPKPWETGGAAPANKPVPDEYNDDGQYVWGSNSAPGNPQAAAERLAGGRKPRTVDEANEMAKQVIERELGSIAEIDDAAEDARTGDEYTKAGAAPWEKTPEPTAKKPWETGNKPAVPSVTLDAGW